MRVTTSLLSTSFWGAGFIGGLVAAVGTYGPAGEMAAIGAFVFVASGCWFYAAALGVLSKIEAHLAFLAHGPQGESKKPLKASRILW